MNKPVIEESVFVAEGAVIRGDVVIGAESSVWFHAVIRAEWASIKVGARTNIQDQAVLHVDAGYPVVVGDDVTIGHGAIVHGCTIGDNTVIGMRSVVMNGAKIGKNCIIGAGAVVTQNIVIPDNSLVLGSPAKVTRPVTETEVQANRRNAQAYVEEAKAYRSES